jgi:hypothetical protein
MNDLYHWDIAKRATATAAVLDLRSETLLAGCRGTPNAAFLLVGPSPGKNGPHEQRLAGGKNRPEKATPDYFGRGLGLMPFDSDPKRSARWAKLLLALCGTQRNAEWLTALWNLDWGHFEREAGKNRIPREHLEEGAKTVVERLPNMFPRIICPLTKTTSYHLFREFAQRAWVRGNVHDTSYRIRLPDRSADTLVIRPPRHPSWPVAADKLDTFRASVAYFLTEN